MGSAAEEATVGSWPVRSFFGRLSRSDQAELLTLARPRMCLPGETVFRQGEPCTDLLMIFVGTISESATPDDGDPVPVAIKGPGDLLGHLAVLDGEREHITTAISTSPKSGLAWAITTRAFEGFLREHHKAGQSLMHYIAGELRRTTHAKVELAGSTARTKVIHVLTELATDFGVHDTDGVDLGVLLSQQELAGLAGVSERAIEQVLSALRREGHVTTRYRRIIIRDLHAFARLRPAGNLPV
jgi:CRP/FNR family cyclic AMP-dependent transcriptional regulator